MLDHETAEAGTTIHASGQLPPGTYCLCIVANGEYVAGEDYSDLKKASTQVTMSGASLPPIEVWDAAESGSYDLLVLEGACTSGAARIMTGDDLGSGAGLVVGGVALPGADPVVLGLALLLVLALPLLRRRRT